MENFIIDILNKNYNSQQSERIMQYSYLIQYLNNKTKSVHKTSKARSSFASIYAIYVLIEDYIKKGYLDKNNNYSEYNGMMFSDALNRIRELPFGQKIQNHALNNRCNDEFKKFFNAYTVKQNVENLILSIFPPLLLGVPRNLFQLFSSEKFSFRKSVA